MRLQIASGEHKLTLFPLNHSEQTKPVVIVHPLYFETSYLSEREFEKGKASALHGEYLRNLDRLIREYPNPILFIERQSCVKPLKRLVTKVLKRTNESSFFFGDDDCLLFPAEERRFYRELQKSIKAVNLAGGYFSLYELSSPQYGERADLTASEMGDCLGEVSENLCTKRFKVNLLLDCIYDYSALEGNQATTCANLRKCYNYLERSK
ncbi:MAG: hypothetical protein AABX11_04505 [Nanoarchaeota archaeon]